VRLVGTSGDFTTSEIGRVQRFDKSEISLQQNRTRYISSVDHALKRRRTVLDGVTSHRVCSVTTRGGVGMLVEMATGWTS
jgi:hypothetical protein